MPHILVVDDDTVVRTMVVRVLEAAGHTVTAAEDGRHALHLLDEMEPDLLLTDLEMPHLGGQALLASVRPRLPRLPVVGMSGAGQRYAGVPEQFDGFVKKPFRIQRMLETIEEALTPAALH